MNIYRNLSSEGKTLESYYGSLPNSGLAFVAKAGLGIAVGYSIIKVSQAITKNWLHDFSREAQLFGAGFVLIGGVAAAFAFGGIVAGVVAIGIIIFDSAVRAFKKPPLQSFYPRLPSEIRNRVYRRYLDTDTQRKLIQALYPHLMKKDEGYKDEFLLVSFDVAKEFHYDGPEDRNQINDYLISLRTALHFFKERTIIPQENFVYTREREIDLIGTLSKFKTMSSIDVVKILENLSPILPNHQKLYDIFAGLKEVYRNNTWYSDYGLDEKALEQFLQFLLRSTDRGEIKINHDYEGIPIRSILGQFARNYTFPLSQLGLLLTFKHSTREQRMLNTLGFFDDKAVQWSELFLTLYDSSPICQELFELSLHDVQPEQKGQLKRVFRNELGKAAEKGDTAKIDFLFSHVSDLNITDLGQGAFQLCSIEMLKHILAHNPKLNEPDVDFSGSTPLHWAAELRDSSKIIFLIERGAFVNAKRNVDKELPIHLYLECSFINKSNWNLEIVKLLFPTDQPLADLSVHYGDSLFHLLARNRISEDEIPEIERIVQFLIEQGLDPNQLNRNGLRPLDWALQMGCSAWIKILQRFSANLTLTQNSFDIASISGLETLFSLNPDQFRADDKGNTPLHRAANSCNGSKIRFLLAHGFSTNAETAKGHLPLHSYLMHVPSAYRFIGGEYTPFSLEIMKLLLPTDRPPSPIPGSKRLLTDIMTILVKEEEEGRLKTIEQKAEWKAIISFFLKAEDRASYEFLPLQEAISVTSRQKSSWLFNILLELGEIAELLPKAQLEIIQN